ncbi:hypothetical protein WG66_009298 [Moniliophthora roreri]|nr:hypothetical protein WG66_009298 [Moniliophthora roreri]
MVLDRTSLSYLYTHARINPMSSIQGFLSFHSTFSLPDPRPGASHSMSGIFRYSAPMRWLFVVVYHFILLYLEHVLALLSRSLDTVAFITSAFFAPTNSP